MRSSEFARSLLGSDWEFKRLQPAYPVVNDILFNPKYWFANGPVTPDFSVIASPGRVTLNFRSYQVNDFLGLIWSSTDLYGHPAVAYKPYFNYAGVVWEFLIELSETMDTIDTPQNMLTFTIENADGVFYVPLYQYADSPETRISRVEIDFDNLIGSAGGTTPNLTIDPTTITKIMLGCVTSAYDADDSSYLEVPIEAYVTLMHLSVTNPRPFRRNNHTSPPHSIGMCTSYDDMNNQAPIRVLDTLIALGYSGRINHYCGMSKYPKKSPIDGVPRMVETPGEVVNNPAYLWHQNLAALAAERDLTLIFSVSFEIFSPWANVNYAQRDWDGVLGVTGYSPPSYLLSPCTAGAMPYLAEVMKMFAGCMVSGGIRPVMQIGEPWWWWNGNTRKPCVYDYPTKLKFYETTGLFAPDLGTIDNMQTGTPYDEFKAFLASELGKACQYLRNEIKAAYPTALVCPLFFLPSIVNPSVGIMNQINFPIAEYSYPNFDFFMTETYDWIIEGKVGESDKAITIPRDVLGYPPQLIEYLAGFVPDTELAAAIGFTVLDERYKLEIWGRVLGVMRNNLVHNVGRQYVWAYPQVARDGVVLSDDLFHGRIWERQLFSSIQTDRPLRHIVR